MIDIFQIFEDMENEERETLLKIQKAKEENASKAEYSPEPELSPPASAEKNLTENSQSSTNISQTETGEKNELQPESVETD